MTELLSIEQLLELHEALLEEFGGAAGLRDRGGLEAAAARPAMSFGGEDLYPDIAAKTAALFHSLVMNRRVEDSEVRARPEPASRGSTGRAVRNHPFLDGNKRIGAAAAELFVETNGYSLDASDQDLEDLTMATARGELQAEAIAIWFRQRLASRER